jgi:hypothetical protein
MFGRRGKIGIETLLKLVLVLLIVILALRVVGYTADILAGILGIAGDVIVLALVIIILLYLLDEI